MCCCCCFSSLAAIWTRTGSHLVPDLQPFDDLETVKLSKDGTPLEIIPDSFYTFLHFDSRKKTEFLVIKTENNAELIITESHLLFKKINNYTGRIICKPVQAKVLELGDSLIYVTSDKLITEVKVVGIGTVILTGVYAPFTKSGTLIVDGFLVSCYADVESHSKAHAFLAPLRFWYSRRKPKFVVSKYETLVNSRNHEGIHQYPDLLRKLRDFGHVLRFVKNLKPRRRHKRDL